MSSRSAPQAGNRTLRAATESQLRAALILSATLLASCATPASRTTTIAFSPASSAEFQPHTRFLMGTACEISVPVDAVHSADAAFDEIARIERLISTWIPGSELSRLNAAQGPWTASVELFELLQRTVTVARSTGGAFNPLIAPLIDAWRTREEGRLPSDEELSAALARMSLSLVTFDTPSREITLRGRAQLEEGGFGKGYALDRAVAALREAAVTRGIVNFGGQISAFGSPLDTSVAHPERRFAPAVNLTIHNQSLSTSSGSEKTFEVQGRRFSHIFDPRTGRALPPRGSASVVAGSAFDADVLSTALYVMGPDAGMKWANANNVAALFIVPKDGSRYVAVPSKALRSSTVVQSVDASIEVKEELNDHP